MIATLFLERAWLLFALMMCLLLGLIAVWSRRRTRRSARAVWIGLGLTALLPAISRIVVTPRERIVQTCHELANLVDRGDVAGIDLYLTDDFQAEGLDRFDFIEQLESALARYHVDDPRLRRFDVAVAGGDAVAVFDAVCSVRSADACFDRVASRWRVTFRQRAGSWRIASIEAIPTPLSPIRDLRAFLHDRG